MVDVDGVLVRSQDGRPWHENLQADLGIDPEELSSRFFAVHFQDVLSGSADLFDRLDLVLPQFCTVSSRTLVDYWFTHDATIDESLLADLRQVKERGAELHLATIQEHHRARFLWESLDLRSDFRAIHYSADVRARKTEIAFYRTVESRTHLQPDKHCLIDDDEINVVAARAAGWQAFRWASDSRLTDVVDVIGL
jgi:putative hydrolase of the HAD superfamily